MAKDSNKSIMQIVIVIAILIVYCAIPPYNKFAQIGYWFNNISYFNSKLFGNNFDKEYIFHRNNAVYLARMNNSSKAIKEMDYAIATLPAQESESVLSNLYRDRATINLYYRDYKKALGDMLRVTSPSITDNLKIAMLLKVEGKNKLAVSYCNKIIDIDLKAYAGYACIADVYANAGKYDASIMIFDLLIDRSPNKAKYYADRANYKKLAGDTKGYEEDLKYATDLSPVVDTKSSITYDTIHPKVLNLSIM